jgi:hypothetical protein
MEPARITKAKKRYISAALNLQRVTSKETRGRLCHITFPDFQGIEGIGNKAVAIREVLEDVMEVRSDEEKKREDKKRIGDIVVGCFRASYPFANLFLTVAKEGSSVITNKKTPSNFL